MTTIRYALMETDSNQLERPEKVKDAVRMLYVAWGIGVVRSVMMLSDQLDRARGLFIFCVILGVLLFFIAMIGRGKSWARSLYFGAFILGLLSGMSVLYSSFATVPTLFCLGGIKIILETLALILLFQKDSLAWFKFMKVKK